MNSYSETEVDAFMRRLWTIIVVCFVLLMIPLALYAYYTERRLNTFEDALRFRTPEATDDAAVDAEFEGSMANAAEGQLVYVPAYSHVYHEDGRPQLVTVTLSVRNTSLDRDIVVTSVRYYDTKGELVKTHLEKPLRLGPLGTAEFLVERDDATGGSGANFLVQWVADEPVNAPIIEAVMIDTSGQQGISFARPGTVLKERNSDPESSDAVSNSPDL